MSDDMKLSENGEKELRKAIKYFDKVIAEVSLDASRASKDKDVQGMLIDYANSELHKLQAYLYIANGMGEISGKERLYIWRKLVIKLADYWESIF